MLRKLINDPSVLALAMIIQLHSMSFISTTAVSIIEITEDLPPGTVIIDNIHRRLHLSPGSNDIYAAIGNPSSPGISSLDLRPHRFDGTLQLVVKSGHRGPDREELCNVQQTNPYSTTPFCDITLVIIHGNRQNPSYAKVTLRVTDVNDNAPVFPKATEYEIRIPEDSGRIDQTGLSYYQPLGRSISTTTKYPLPVAHDPDLNENGVKYYRLTTKTGKEIDNSVLILTNQNDEADTSLGSVVSPALQVIGPLDREKVSDYWFTLLAIDGGVPQKTGTLLVHVIVTDLNDNAPEFRKPTYYYPTFSSTRHDILSSQQKGEILRVPESVPIGADLLLLYADDKDDGVNAQLTYRIRETLSGQGESLIQQSLKLIPSNGGVKLGVTKQLDADNVLGNTWSDPDLDVHGNLIHVTVKVADGGSPPLSSTITIPILIENINDNRPEIAVQFVNPVPEQVLADRNVSRFVGSLKENVPGPTTVAHVTVTDADRKATVDSSGRGFKESVKCELNDTRFSLEQISSLSSQSVTDLLGSPTSSPTSYFYRISALSSFDREQAEWIHIAITCVDQFSTEQTRYAYGQFNRRRSGIQLTGSALISLKLIDVNDNAPKFSLDTYRFSVPETPNLANLVNGNEKTLIGRVDAVDMDVGLNGQVHYKLLSNPREAFKLEESDGTLWRIGTIDRERDAELHFKIVAYDEGEPVLSGTGSVIVQIQDVNDHPPYWITSTAEHDIIDNTWIKSEDGVFYFSVAEDTAVGKTIGQITAVDIDGFIHGAVDFQKEDKGLKSREPNIEYKLERVEEASIFSINRRTGELRLSRKLDREVRAHFELRVFAVDSPDGSHGSAHPQWSINRYTATATVFITVLDVNDNQPQFESPLPGQEFHIDPTSALVTPGTTLFTASAHDADNGENATVRYALEGAGLGLVEIDTTTGVCYIRETMNRNTMMETMLSSTNDGGRLTSGARLEGVQSELRSFSVGLTIVAYDTGTPISLNSSRKVRLVWNAQTSNDAKTVYEKQGLLKSIYGIHGAKFTRIEQLLIPLMVGAFVLLIVVCGILFGLARKRQMNKRHLRSERRESEMDEEYGYFRWCTNCVRSGDDSLNSVKNTNNTIKQKSSAFDLYQQRQEFQASSDRCTSSLGQLISDDSKMYLPDCIPQYEPEASSTPQRNQFQRLFINSPKAPGDWKLRSQSTTLSKALSEESLNVLKTNEFGYTALCAFPSMQPEDELVRFPSYHNEYRPATLQTEGHKLARPIAFRPQTLNTRPVVYNPLSLASTRDVCYPTFHSREYSQSPTDAVPQTPGYEQFELETTDKSSGINGAGWKPKLSETYTENTFV